MFTKGLLLKVIFGGLIVLTAITGVIYLAFAKPYAPTLVDVTIPNLGGTDLANCTPVIHFLDNSQNEDEFRVYRRNLGVTAFNLIQILPPSPGKSSQVGYADRPLPLGTYEYKVSSYNKYGESFSDIKKGTVVYATACVQIPSVDPSKLPMNPLIVSLSIINDCNVRLSIRDNSTNEQGFKIYRALSGPHGFTFVANLGPHTGIPMTYDDKTKLPEGEYNYLIIAYNKIGSNNSNFPGIKVTSVCNPVMHAMPTVDVLLVPTAKKLSLNLTQEPSQTPSQVPSEIPSLTPSAVPCTWQAVTNVFLRKGPNVELFEHSADEKTGTILPIVGQSQDGYFWAVKTATGEIGYITKSKTFSQTAGDCSSVPTLKDPLPPKIKPAATEKPAGKKVPTACPVGAVCP